MSDSLKGEPNKVLTKTVIENDNTDSFEDIEVIAEGKSGQVHYIGPGYKSNPNDRWKLGWNHVKFRHITTKYRDPGTDYFPLGQDWNSKIPDLMDKEDVKELFRKGVEKKPAGANDYTFDPDIDGIDEVKIAVGNNGRVKTLYPTSGSKVPYWDGSSLVIGSTSSTSAYNMTNSTNATNKSVGAAVSNQSITTPKVTDTRTIVAKT